LVAIQKKGGVKGKKGPPRVGEKAGNYWRKKRGKKELKTGTFDKILNPWEKTQQGKV